MSSTLLAKTANEGNIVDFVNELAQRLERVERGEVLAQSVDEISTSLGRIEDGELRFGEGEPDDPEHPFSGRRIVYPPVEVVVEGETFLLTDVGMEAGALTFGLSAKDGSAIFSRGKGRIGGDGIRMGGLDYLFQHTASNGIHTRIGRLRMTLPTGGWEDAPAWSFELDEPRFDAVYRLLSRYVGPTGTPQGDFETDGLTYWQADGVTAALCSTLRRAGAYSVRITSPVENVQANGVYNGDFAITEARPGYAYLQAAGWRLSDYDHPAQAFGCSGVSGGVDYYLALTIVDAGYGQEFYAASDAVSLSGEHNTLQVEYEIKTGAGGARLVWLDELGEEVGRSATFRSNPSEDYQAVRALAAIPGGAAGYRVEFVGDLEARNVCCCEGDTVPGRGEFSYRANVAAPTDGEYWFTMWVHVNGVSTAAAVQVDWEDGGQQTMMVSEVLSRSFSGADWEGATASFRPGGSYGAQYYARLRFGFAWETTPLDVRLDNLTLDRLQAMATQRLMFYNGGLYLDNAPLCLEKGALPTPGSGFVTLGMDEQGTAMVRDEYGQAAALALASQLWLQGG